MNGIMCGCRCRSGIMCGCGCGGCSGEMARAGRKIHERIRKLGAAMRKGGRRERLGIGILEHVIIRVIMILGRRGIVRVRGRGTPSVSLEIGRYVYAQCRFSGTGISSVRDIDTRIHPRVEIPLIRKARPAFKPNR